VRHRYQQHHHEPVDDAGSREQPVGAEPAAEPWQQKSAADGAAAQGAEQQSVAVGAEPETVAGDERQESPDRGGREHEEAEAEEDSTGHRRVAHVAASRP